MANSENSEFLNSGLVRVFPTAYRKTVKANGGDVTYNPESKLNTEFNLTSMASRFASKDSFVLNYDEGTDMMTVSMKGYWFELSKVKEKAGRPLWATILIKEANPTSDSNKISIPTLYSMKDGTTTLDNLDDADGNFYGIKFSNSQPTEKTDRYSLNLFDDSGNVPDSSYLRISTKHIEDSAATDSSKSKSPISTQLTTVGVSATTVSATTVSADTLKGNVEAESASVDNMKVNTEFNYPAICTSTTTSITTSGTVYNPWISSNIASYNGIPLKYQGLDLSSSITAYVPFVAKSTISSDKTITAPSFNATSDARLKENLTSLERVDGILDLPLYEFDYTNGSGHSLGCIAQDLRKMAPGLVDEDAEGYLSVKESKLVYLLLMEVRALRDELRELRETKR